MVAGTLARLLLGHVGVGIVSHVVRIGPVAVTNGYRPTMG